MFSSTIGTEVHLFQLKNIYLMTLLLIDEKRDKKLFYTDIVKEIRPLGVGNIKVKAEL